MERASDDENLMESLSEKLKKVNPMSPNWCICRVPKRLRQVNPDAYTPHLISIGPFHHKEAELAEMEELKWQYTVSLLRRVEKDHPLEGPLRSCARAILHADKEIRNWYATSINLSTQELARVLLLDSCFILELFFRYSETETSIKVQNDPVFRSEWMLSCFRRDLALLENQIPFFVLERLFYTVAEHDESLRADYLPRMAFNFFFESKRGNLFLMEGGGSNRIREYKHLLDLLLVCHLPNRLVTRGDSTRVIFDDSCMATVAHEATVPNIKSLIDAGGSIKRVVNTSDLLDIKFSNGELQIPPIHIDEWTDSLFRNLIAFEHCFPENVNSERSKYMVSYVALMNRLIESHEDIELLMSKGIITVELGGSKDVTKFFKKICKQVIVKDFYFQEVCEEMEKFHKARVHYKELKRTSFKNPWTLLSLFAGVLLLLFSSIQAVVTLIHESSHKPLKVKL